MTRWVKFIISLCLLYLAIYFLDLQVILDLLKKQVSLAVFVSAIAINLLAFGVMAYRWHVISKAANPISLCDQFSLYFKATFFNTFSPSNIGGDAYRFMILKANLLSTGLILRLLLRERVFGVYGFLFTFAISFLILKFLGNEVILEIFNPFWLGFTFSMILIFFPYIIRASRVNIYKLLPSFLNNLNFIKVKDWGNHFSYLFSLKNSLTPLLLTFVGVFLWIFSIKIIVNSLGFNFPFTHLMLTATLVEIIRMIPITIQGVGLREGLFAYLLVLLGHDPEQSYVIGLVAYLALSVSIILCGPIGHLFVVGKRIK